MTDADTWVPSPTHEVLSGGRNQSMMWTNQPGSNWQRGRLSAFPARRPHHVLGSNRESFSGTSTPGVVIRTLTWFREPRLPVSHFSALPGSVFRTASTRPCSIAATRAAWSRSVWSPYASAKSTRARSRTLELPQ